MLREAVVVEFGGPEHAIFLSTLPLEFDDRVRIEANGEGRPTEATVVGVQYHEGRKAVAVIQAVYESARTGRTEKVASG